MSAPAPRPCVFSPKTDSKPCCCYADYPQMYAQWELFLEGIVEKEALPALIAQAEA